MTEATSTDALLNSFIKTSHEGFCSCDRSGQLVKVNEGAAAMLGYTPEDLEGRLLADLEVEQETFQLRSIWPEVLKKEGKQLVLPCSRKDGSVCHVHFTFTFCPVSEGKICVFMHDVSELEKSLTLMRLQTEALAAAANAVAITDAEGVVVWVNRAFSRFTGYTPDEAVGGRPGDLLKSGRHDESFYRKMWETIKRGEVWRGEIINRRKNGSLYSEEMTITPLCDPEGVITHYIAIKQDLTEQKKMEQMFLRSQRMESIGTLASGIAHDLNNVLSPIVMSVDLMMLQAEDDRTREMLSMIKEGAKRGADITRQLLNFARGESGELVELQLRPLLKQMVKVYRETFPKTIEINESLADDLRPVKGEATQIHQILTNLLINARDAMPKGGLLNLNAENITLDARKADEIPGAGPGSFVRIRVKDNGTGMSPEIQSKIYDSFFTTKPVGQGTGLGLSTSLTILKVHNGFMTCDSMPGKGTTFDVYIPVFRGENSDSEDEEEPEVPMGAGEHILVVDDEESIGFMLKGTLRSLGYRVNIVTSGPAALKWLESNPYCDLVLLDMMMPKMDGAEVLRRLKASECKAKVLLMSGMVAEDLLHSTGVDLEESFLAKPFNIMDLGVKLRALLDD